MSNVDKFEEILRSDEALQKKLADAAQALETEMDDEKAFFEAVVAPIAAEAGLPFTFEEMVEAGSSRELSDSELDAVAGGGICFIIGADDDVSADCAVGGTTCAIVGVTFGGD